MKKTLYLILTKRWFNAIATGAKKFEYRQRTNFWAKKLGKSYDEILFQNGYHPDAPTMRVEFLGVEPEPIYVAQPPYAADNPPINFGDCYAIRLGRVLEIKNWKCPSPSPAPSAPSSSPDLRASASLS